MNAAVSEEQVGVIVVHGIGDEKPHEHLESVVRPLANGLAAKNRRVTVVDQPQAPDGEPQAWILVRSVGARNDRLTRIGVHEVYWADINEPSSLMKGLKFWLWGLSAWFTPGRLGSRSRVFNETMASPRFAGRDPRSSLDLFDRLHLFFVGWVFFLAAPVITALDFLAQRVFHTRLPASVATIVTYVSAVRLYTQPRRAGSGFLESCNEAPRFAIRRRMARVLADVAARRYDRWYVLAHSQGTVVALNGLMAAAPAFAAYLDDHRLARLEQLGMAGSRRGALDGPPADAVAADPLFAPAVPADRIGQDLVVWRDALFERFAGLLTYGSPLDKFAAIWAPVAALSRAAGIFPQGARWLNVWDPTDPVGAHLDAYEPDLVYKSAPALPDLPGREKLRPRNIAVVANPVLLLSHVCYFQRLSGHPQPLACCVGDWLLDPADGITRLRPLSARATTVRTALRLVEVAILVLLLLVLWVVLFRSVVGPMLRPLFGVAASACLNVPPTWSDCGSQVVGDVKLWALSSLVLALVVGVVGRYTTTLDAADQRVIDSPFGGRIRTLMGLAVTRARTAAKARRPKPPNP